MTGSVATPAATGAAADVLLSKGLTDAPLGRSGPKFSKVRGVRLTSLASAVQADPPLAG